MISRSGNSRRQAPIMNSAVTDVPSGAASKIGDVPLQARRVLAQAFRTRSTVFMPPESRINLRA